MISILHNVKILKITLNSAKKKFFCEQKIELSKGLMYKVHNIGIRGKMFKILKSIIMDSTLIVTSGDWYEPPFRIESGICQGYSISGPLFNLYINDMIGSIRTNHNNHCIYNIDISRCLLYADNIITISESPQENNIVLETVDSYCKKWKLNIDTSKCIITSTRKHKQIKKFKHALDITNVAQVVTYLSIIFNTKTLTWKEHVENRSSKASAILYNSIFNGIIGGNIGLHTQRKYYTTAIRPVLEYGCKVILVGPTLLKKLESVQQFALTRILGTYRTSFKPAVRILMGVPPMGARNEVLLLVNWMTKFK
ncbi:hypothetical protein RFI_35399 [Reticulomyxa filosa]|uniref:Reverse transcriptase domain-containing protein n=1 Tax=Reticulomyxa filosa TaxID=46433 RepID=X6LLM6_RETFI|nr:hypothetical protein RFI_35399 [Reticulomyxa filosa]|eukprot:ETO02037.1 hypothetical protein RFI_35399 [Reticulomyxa filosa]